jgi:ribonuclease P protein subunit POP4
LSELLSKKIVPICNNKKTNLDYKKFLNLNSLWLDYMRHMLGIKKFTSLIMESTNTRWESINQHLIKADYHGAKVTVIRSKCPSTVGLQGIIIQDTKNTFILLNRENKVICKFSRFSCIL